MSCAPPDNANPCTLVGTVGASAAVAAVFVAVFDLAVSAGDGGSVDVMLNGGDAGTVGAGASSAVTVAAGDAVTLTAMAEAGQRFASWNLSDGLSCAPSENASPCTLGGHGAGAAAATATFVAVFDLAVGAGDGGEVGVSLNGGDAGTVSAGASSVGDGDGAGGAGGDRPGVAAVEHDVHRAAVTGADRQVEDGHEGGGRGRRPGAMPAQRAGAGVLRRRA